MQPFPHYVANELAYILSILYYYIQKTLYCYIKKKKTVYNIFNVFVFACLSSSVLGNYGCVKYVMFSSGD